MSCLRPIYKIQPQVIGHLEPLSLNKVFDPSTPSMRKGDNGGAKKTEMMKIVATNVVASRPPNGDRLQRRPLVPKERKKEEF